MTWKIDDVKVKKSERPHSMCCACNCVVDLIRDLRARHHLLETTLKVVQGKMLDRSVIWELIEGVLKK